MEQLAYQDGFNVKILNTMRGNSDKNSNRNAIEISDI